MQLLVCKSARIFASVALLAVCGCAGSPQIVQKSNSSDYDTLQAQRFDTGRMWTFDNPPVEYFNKTYGMNIGDEWLEKARKSALRFATYCSASFVSEDGLVMTNHHCGRESVTGVTKDGENLHSEGFFAKTPADERQVKGLFVDQLVLIKDVTKEVQDAAEKGETDAEKVQNKKDKIKEIEARYKEETGLKTSVVTLYAGGQYSLYGYKTYNDVRLVFAPENGLGFYGGDYDNFTYPRYDLDFTFFRVYDENGKPLKTDNFFKWSQKGAAEGDPVFVVGNPGRTNRLNTIAQLEYMRDNQYPASLNIMNGLISCYSKVIETNPGKSAKYEDKLFGFSNSQKVYYGIIKGLNDPSLMARKKDFEKKFRAAVDAKPELREKYGFIWDAIRGTRAEIRKFALEFNAISWSSYITSKYFTVAKDLMELAKKNQLGVDSLVSAVLPADFDQQLNEKLLKLNADAYIAYFGEDNEIVRKVFGGKKGSEAAAFMISHSSLTSAERIKALAQKGSEAVLNSDDPFISFLSKTSERVAELKSKVKEIQDKEAVNVQLLGKALYEVYGHSIPPDATFTLRIADGVVKGYDYNGTIAPAKTTFHGLYDRYYSFNKKYPYDLPKIWQNPPAEFNLETPMNFVATCDIIGGNSGSPVINRNLEIVGLAFDGNIESLPADFIFTTEANRTVGVDSEGLVEAVQDLYQAKRLSEELRTGKIPEQFKK